MISDVRVTAPNIVPNEPGFAGFQCLECGDLWDGEVRVTSRAADDRLQVRYLDHLLEAARAAMARGHFGDVLARTQQHRTRFPDGELGEERDALRIEALVRLGDFERAQRAADDFFLVQPSSLYRGRIERLLSTDAAESQSP